MLYGHGSVALGPRSGAQMIDIEIKGSTLSHIGLVNYTDQEPGATRARPRQPR